MAQSNFDLIWSEGALYNIGIPRALSICGGPLRKGGYLVFTDAVWCKARLPDSVKAIFESDYPTMGTVADLVSLIERSPFELLNHFPLPPEAWWDDFFTPRWNGLLRNSLENTRMIQKRQKSSSNLY